MKYDCLIVDDEKELADNTCEYLNDINLQDGSGFDLCKQLRKEKDIPILFISARNTDDDKIIALNIGGDDYIEKPYSLGVLLAKVKVMLKRFKKEDLKEFNDGNLRVDFQNKEVYLKDNLVKLTSLEYKLLTYLINNSNRLVTKDELFDNVWQDKFTGDGTLNVHIRKIREAIEIDPNNPKYITTVWKEGYKFEGESK